jgi:hypothetical protein
MATTNIPRNLADEFCSKTKPSTKDIYLKDSLVPGLVLRITPPRKQNVATALQGT